MSRGAEVVRLGSDHRTLPVVPLLPEDLDRLATCFTGQRLPPARSVYVAIVELVYSGPIGGTAEATRREVADKAGVTIKTLDNYVEALEVERFISVERRRDGAGGNLPNLWMLGISQGGENLTAPGSADHPQHPSASSLFTEAGVGERGVRGGRGIQVARMLSGMQVGADLVDEAVSLFAQRKRVDGKVVTADEIVVAAAALAEYNRQAEQEAGLPAHVTKLVMRIRERPKASAEKHVALVQSAFRLRWWEKRGRPSRVSPAKIWGSTQCFENVIADALDEKNGRERPRNRFQKSGPPEQQS